MHENPNTVYSALILVMVVLVVLFQTASFAQDKAIRQRQAELHASISAAVTKSGQTTKTPEDKIVSESRVGETGPAAKHHPCPVVNPDSKSKEKGDGTDDRSLASPIVNINTAQAFALMQLPGIGHRRALDIINQRKRRPFKRRYDLMRVPGIGRKTYARLKPLIRVHDEPALEPPQ